MEIERPQRGELGIYLCRLRKEKNYSQEYVASKLGICRQTYSHYETGRIKPSIKIICRLAMLYGIAAEELLALYAESGMIENEWNNDSKVERRSVWREDELYDLDEQGDQILYYYEHLDEQGKEMLVAVVKAIFEKQGEQNRPV